MTLRLFTAVYPDRGFIRSYLEYESHFTDNSLDWTIPEDLHLTRTPPINAASTEYFRGSLCNLLISNTPLVLLNLIEYRTTNQQTGILWIRGISNPNLDALGNKLHKSLNINNGRPYLPHITLARTKAAIAPPAIARDLSTIPLSCVINIEEICIVESTNDPDGRYKIRDRLPLISKV